MYVFGKNVVKEILNNKMHVKRAYLVNNFNDNEIKNKLDELGVDVRYLTKQELDKLEKGNHQGIVVEVSDFKYVNESDMFNNMPSKPFVVILDHLEDTHNFGAIIRTCEAAGVNFIIIPKNRSVCVNATVVKTSVGAVYNVKIVMVTNLNNTIKKLKQSGLWIVGTDMINSVSYDKIDYNLPIALVIGSEGFGMSELVRKNCDFIANIPMYGKVNSLNASVAAGIMIYEVVRQRK